ncbi:MAG: peptidoglycan DD-metalloendopeptidase family protein [Nitrospirota bacterium]|nr:peptidoglycan DD-metalloendopeptidase family protein [Nitrospirota bacterium]
MLQRTSILIFSLLALLTFSPALAGDDDARQQELKRIKQEMAEKKKKLKRAGRKERSTLSELEKIDRAIHAGGAELAEQQIKLREAETALAGMEQDRERIAGEIGRLRPLFAARLRALYKVQRSGGFALALLSSENIDTATRRARALAVIANRDQRLIAEYQETLRRLETTREELKDRQAEIRGRTEAVASKRASLEERRKKKRTLLASIKQEKSSYEETLRELEESSINLWAMIHEAEKERAAAARRKQEAPQPRVSGRGALPWPVQGPVLTRFGTQRHPQFGTVVYRRGIEIQAQEGEEVRTVSAGQVAFADWYKGYGRLVIVDHGDGLYTLYGHLSVLNTSAGDRVERGQVVGRAGDTGSFAGPRLYFELRRNGVAQDPLLWLAKQ